MKKLSSSKIKNIKSTRLGRLLSRLVGDEAGQGMMEYVVIGVLVVAAAVAVVMLFGDQIRTQFAKMTHATGGQHTKASELTARNNENEAAVQGALDEGDLTANKEQQ